MAKRSVTEAAVAGKRVLLRVDFNVPMEGGRISDDTRIRAALPTVRDVLDRGGRVVLASHLGRPKGKVVEGLRLAPVAARVSELLGQPVPVLPAVVGPEVESAVGALEPGRAVLLENVRFEPGEEKNDATLARQLASLADVFVNDAFGAAHRAHASTTGVAAHLPAYAGLLMQKELDALGQLLDNPARPFVAILGGAKVSDKLAVLQNLLARVDALLIGGAMANTFLLAEGFEVGSSLVERDLVAQARSLMGEAKRRGVKLLLPSDVVVAEKLEAPAGVEPVASMSADRAIFDIGPDTRLRFAREIEAARTVFWNGPMGVFEHWQFGDGTRAVAEAVARANAFTVVGGGDSVAAVEQLGLADKISHISTGGGASLEYVEGRKLPGVEALLDARPGGAA